MAICKTLNHDFDLPVKIKWPNDIVYKGKKIAGMLSEARIDGSLTRSVVFGIGINVNSQRKDWPEQLQHTALSLSEVANKALDINKVAAALISSGLTAYEQFISGQYKKPFESDWKSMDALLEQVITVNQNQQHITGKAKGIDPDGALILELENSEVTRFQAGDVTLHKAYQP